ncbi:pyridoxal-phosphate-dependent aminotransferase family protein [Tropicibacter naphthalenivorans]|uniref:Soluble hydrogenase 42 kDa subunit n=1 Tax=Tropicibacter naphthalenivorans TaxID=441103 RepID=A0A0P1GI55_9RHOB|nr:aminotransferase class V-fold PLP-dependent enzyme [Tropicibacter naphthalenivorans]CUH81479.1 Soluble hydrogenase 42 kDa subunit [Tropicibacter naphthalenivorans]SMD00212.1 alanine-glyoxylate transaminase / serine-glyoxylate transaminase / serine-pyruvate transaminase [Tropicibacter naphthalenivorans]
MSLANGRPHIAIPGPSVMPDRVLQAMHRPAPDIYDPGLVQIMSSIVPDLKYVAQTDGYVAMYIANGHGIWEASLQNVTDPGDTVLVPATGRFGHGWAETARSIGLTVDVIEHGRQSPIDPERVRAALRADTDHKIKAVLAVHVDTSSSVRSDIAALRKVIDAEAHPALLMVDCIASLGCDRFEMDAWGADVMLAASQKGLMTPPGMGFVFFNERAKARRAEVKSVSFYWDWSNRAEPEMFYMYFAGTAPTHLLYALREALTMIREEGIEAVWERHARLAQMLWTAVEHWGQDGAFRLNIADPAHRSHAVTAAGLGKGQGDRLRAWLTEQAGVTLGIGLGAEDADDPTASGYFRFGHMGHVNAHMMLGVLGAVEAGLTALEIPHRAGGVTAAAQAMAAKP